MKIRVGCFKKSAKAYCYLNLCLLKASKRKKYIFVAYNPIILCYISVNIVSCCNWKNFKTENLRGRTCHIKKIHSINDDNSSIILYGKTKKY